MSNAWPRAGGVIGRLLFIGVLALGIVAMHSAGHPDGSSGQGMSGHSTGSAVHAGGTLAAAADPAHDATGHGAASAKAVADPGSATTERAAVTDGLTTGMDMASICLAILGTWAFAALLRAAFARSGGNRTANALLRTLATMRPRPPPPRPPDLARLSVLRI